MTEPKHGGRGRPTRGAVILFIIVGLAGGAWAIVQGFQHSNDVRHIGQGAECSTRIFNDNVARVQALAHLQDEGFAAQRELDARWARDVVTQNIRDIPRAYNHFRAEIIKINAERARLGVVITASTPPPGCKLEVKTVPPTAVPKLSITPSATPKPSKKRATASSDNVPPLPNVVTITQTVAAETFTVPGPTVRVTVTVTRTVTRPPKPTPGRTCIPSTLRPCR